MNKKNQTLKEKFALAFENYKKKDYKSAEFICNQILTIDENHFDSIFLLSTLSAIQGNFEKTKKFLKKAIEIEPKNFSAYNNLGNAEKYLGNLKEAINSYNKAMEINPNNPNSYFNTGIVHFESGNFLEAQKFFEKTIEILPNHGTAHFYLGNNYVHLKDNKNAIKYYQKAIEIKPSNAGAHNNLGLVFRAQNDFNNAISSYKKAIEINPNHGGAHHNLALAFKEIGEFKKAINSHEMGIKSEPENLTHYYYLSELKEDVVGENLKNKTEKIIKKKDVSKRNLAYGNFILAKLERQKKNFKKELDFLIKGHQAFFDSKKNKFKLGIKYCFDDAIKISESAKVTSSSNKNDYDLKPIFIIGVPRCGSTLVEKIIASGSKNIPMGEESAVIENFVNKKIIDRESLNLGNVDDLRKELFSIYEDKNLLLGKSNYIFTDKSLNNFFYLDLIKDIYPKAKIINCKRDILSSIVSIFQNNLTELAWSHNLENIFKYFDNYLNIISNYKEIYPDMIYDLELEKLIDNPETESKKLMNFCNLTWDKKCLEFYKRKDLISKTASNIQIRKAIFKQSSEKYLPYKQLLNEHGKQYSWFN